MFRNQKGLTVIELLIIVLIIGILAAVATPRFMEVSARSEAMRNLGTMQAVQEVYFAEHKVYATDVLVLAKSDLASLRLQEIGNRLEKGLPLSYEITYSMTVFPVNADSFSYAISATSPRFPGAYVIGPDGVIKKK